MKRIFIFLIAIIIIIFPQFIYAQSSVRLGDLPKSEYTINVYQVIGFHEGYEGYKITYLDNSCEPKQFYLPIALRDKYSIYAPQNNTYDQNFLITWQKEGKITRIEWFMPRVINYDLPYYVIKPFNQRDQDIFKSIADKGEIVFGMEIGGFAPKIKAPGSIE